MLKSPTATLNSFALCQLCKSYQAACGFSGGCADRREAEASVPTVCGAEETEPAGEVSHARLTRKAAQSETAGGQLSPAAAEFALRDPPPAEGGHKVPAVQVSRRTWQESKSTHYQ